MKRAWRTFRRAGTSLLQREQHIRVVRRALKGNIANLRDIQSYIVAHPKQLKVPAVIVSQVRRSGGTLLNQLFDGHPALATYPHDLKIGGKRGAWNLIGPERNAQANFLQLFSTNAVRLMQLGYAKVEREEEAATERHSFLFVPSVQYALFKRLCETEKPVSRRDIVDHFFRAYFNAWLDYQGDLNKKRWITAFALSSPDNDRNIDDFFHLYPDGLLIQLIRNPESWYLKECGHIKSAGRTPDEILEMWQTSTRSILRNKQLYGDAVIIVRFEDLICNTEQIMRRLSQLLRIEYNPIFLQPTFNGIGLASSVGLMREAAGSLDSGLSSERMLSHHNLSIDIDRCCFPLYEEVVKHAVTVVECSVRL